MVTVAGVTVVEETAVVAMAVGEREEAERGEEEMELPLEGEEDLARLERILKRGRSRAGTVEDVEL